jgi:imidazole glycerol-phosphate synthase subunit HisH
MNVLLFDYGTGNLHSLRKALELQGARVTTGTTLEQADALVLPGVGAFGAAAIRLDPHREAIRDAVSGGLPVLGICLGMQLLLDNSAEGDGTGLGIVHGTVRPLRTTRVPHMGWNVVTTCGVEPLFRGVDGERFYFANGYVADPVIADAVTAVTRHEADTFPAAIRAGGAVGTQFHPEKSGPAGLRLLRNFLEQAR